MVPGRSTSPIWTQRITPPACNHSQYRNPPNAGGVPQKASSGDTVTAIFCLKTQVGWREADRKDQGTDGKVNYTLVTVVPRAYNR